MDRLCIVAAALLFSTGGVAIKACTLSSWQVAGFRSAVAVVALLLMLPGARSRWTGHTLAVGLAYAATLILFVWANKLTTAANSIFLQSTAPLYVVLLAPWLLREPVRRRDLLFMAVLAVGLGMFFVGGGPAFATAPQPLPGNVVAALSGVTWALTIVGLRWMGARSAAPVGAALVCGNLIACLACLPLALPVNHSQMTDWLVVGYLGFFQIGVAYVFLSSGVRHVPALEVSLLLLLEPVLNPIWAWAVHAEHPGAWALTGGAVIVLATAMKAVGAGGWGLGVSGTSSQPPAPNP